MAFSMAGGSPRGPQINVTPLIDVLLTLIIMFMLVVSMDKEYRKRFKSPNHRRSSAEPPPERTVVIQVVWTSKGVPPTVKINQEDVRWEDLELRLAQIYLKRAEKVGLRPWRCRRGFLSMSLTRSIWRITPACSALGF